MADFDSMMRRKTLAAKPCGAYNGKQYYRVPVLVLHNDSRQCMTIESWWTTVIAPSAAAAANLVRREVETIPETEITAFGPKGGKVHRYVGWESAIGAALLQTSSGAVRGRQ